MDGTSAGGLLSAGAEDLLYKPTPKERSWKVRFWARMADNPLLSVENATLALVQEYCGAGADALRRRWSAPGFREWFLNQDEHRERLEYLFGLALNAAEDILTNTDPKAQSARVNIIKVLAELAGKFPRQRDVGKSPIEAALEGMDRASLGLFLQKQGVSLSVEASKGAPTHPTAPQARNVLPGPIVDLEPEE